MRNILLKIKEFLTRYKKKIIKGIGISILAIAIIAGGIFAVVYSRATSSLKYSQDALQEIALTKVPGEVVEVEKDLNFRNSSFVYEFKIKDKENILQEVKVDSKYGTLLSKNDENHKRENKFVNDQNNRKENKSSNDEHKSRDSKN
jgi:uncharacterized membrane protein YkoI